MAARASSKGPAAGVFAVVGEDSFLAERELAALLRARSDPEGDGVETLRGDETTWNKVVDLARTQSLFAARRAVVVRAAEGLKGSDTPLAGYLDDPNPDVTLIFVLGKVDKRLGVWKRLLERAQTLSAEPLKGAKLRAYVAEEVARRRLPLAGDGLAELLERVGQDLRRLMGEIDKLESYVDGARGRLGADEVAKVLGRGLARPLYKLADAFWARRPVEVLELTQELLDDGEAAPRLLATLHRALRQLRAARAHLERRTPSDQLAARLGVMPFKVRELCDAARGWSEVDLERALLALSRADRRLKTGTADEPALAAAIVEACGETGARPGPRDR
jgi:DNA polymerase-3 subunit delta